MNYKKVCSVCGKTISGAEYKKVIKVFCSDCLTAIRNQSWIKNWNAEKQERSLRIERSE